MEEPTMSDDSPPVDRGNPGVRDANGRFPKGVSGNPNGLPTGRGHSVKAVQAYASEYTLEMVDILVLIARDKKRPTADRIKAADKVLDRACGRPAQPITGEGDQPFESGFPTFLAALRKISGEDIDPAFAPPRPVIDVTPAPEGEPASEG